jgi:pimeloyl-ACP methyl ester carboxylesterase
LSVDLPFHGETEWRGSLLVHPEELIAILEQALMKSGFERGSIFSLLAFSLGGRIALYLLQLIPQRIKRVVLVAPDGLHVNFWYWLGTQTWLGNKLFHATMKDPAWFFVMLDFANKTSWLNKSIIKLVHYYLDDKEERILLYERWTALRRFKPNIPVIKKNIAVHKIPVRFVFGQYDRIIPEKRGHVFKTDKSNVRVLILQAGHQLLKEKYMPDIARQFSE